MPPPRCCAVTRAAPGRAGATSPPAQAPPVPALPRARPPRRPRPGVDAAPSQGSRTRPRALHAAAARAPLLCRCFLQRSAAACRWRYRRRRRRTHATLRHLPARAQQTRRRVRLQGPRHLPSLRPRTPGDARHPPRRAAARGHRPPKVPGGLVRPAFHGEPPRQRSQPLPPALPLHLLRRTPRSPRPAGRAHRSGGGRGTGGLQHLEEDLGRAAGRLPAAGAGVARRALGEPRALVEAARIARLGSPSSAPSLRTSARRSGLAGADLAQPHRGRTATRPCGGSTHPSLTPALPASPPASAPPAQRNAPARRARRDRGVPRSRLHPWRICPRRMLCVLQSLAILLVQRPVVSCPAILALRPHALAPWPIILAVLGRET